MYVPVSFPLSSKESATFTVAVYKSQSATVDMHNHPPHHHHFSIQVAYVEANARYVKLQVLDLAEAFALELQAHP
jgi:hypothetical protein